MTTIYEEVTAAARTELQDNETYAVFAKRVALKLNKSPDTVWNTLSDVPTKAGAAPTGAQQWVNEVLVALDKKGELPALDGFPEVEEKPGTDGEEAGEGEETPPEDAEGEDPPETDEEGQEEAEAEEGEEAPPKPAKRASEPRKAAAKPKAAAKKAAPAKAKAAKPAKAAKASKKAAGANGGEKGRPSNFDRSAKIKLLVEDNPHRAGTKNHTTFKRYKSGMTVAEAVKAGIPLSNIRYVASLGHIKVG